jgi:hypothetical protein
MMSQKKNLLLLKSKNDIPFFEGQINIHQPTISEISFIGEDTFHIGVRFLAFNKEDIDKDNFDLAEMSDFDIFMSIVNQKNSPYKTKVLMVLSLIFPGYNISFKQDKIIMTKGNEQKEINNRNFPSFKNNIIDMFCLDELDEGKQKKYNPTKGRAEKIAEKLKAAEKRRNKKKGKKMDENISIYSYYISVLAVGEQKDWNTLMNYTIPQLLDEFKRFQRKIEYDSYAAAAMAGATDLDEVTHWMIDE